MTAIRLNGASMLTNSIRSRELFIECDIQQENVQSRFTKKSKSPTLRETAHELLDLRCIDTASLRDSIELSRRIVGTDMRVEAAAACGQRISRNRAAEIRIFLPELLRRSFYTID